MERNVVCSLAPEVRRASFFDPQFFLPGSTRGKLATYEFFPSVILEQFSTSEYDEDDAERSAELCVQFQIHNEFRYCVIPTRHREGSPNDYIDSQVQTFVAPFLRAYGQSSERPPLLLQLILSDQMLKDARFRSDILNWVTAIDPLHGVYLIPQVFSRRKQIDDIDFLVSLLEFIHAIRLNGMDVIVGYLNTEAIPILIAEPTGIATGSYENLRMFTLTAFDEEERGHPHGPNARIYVPRLLQWIDSRYVGAISRVVGNPRSFFEQSNYEILMFAPTYRWHFTKPEPYKHYFVVFSSQIRRIAAFKGRDRIDAIIEACRSAIAEFQRLEDSGIVLDSDSGPNHLSAWLTAINLFIRQHGL
jgi:hypothetical protein